MRDRLVSDRSNGHYRTVGSEHVLLGIEIDMRSRLFLSLAVKSLTLDCTVQVRGAVRHGRMG